jgi:hypothetical protein
MATTATIPTHTNALEEARALPLDTKFTLGTEISNVQRAFMHLNGYLHFRGAATQGEVDTINGEISGIQERWLAENRTSVYGIPLFVGKDHRGLPFIQRLPFTSNFSPMIRAFVRDDRFKPVRGLIGEHTRVGDEEKDGVVFNRNMNVPSSAYSRLGWHTDGLRALAYLRMPGPMLNVGFHLDRITKDDGGLRLIPGTHKQGLFKMCFHKAYFLSHRPDSKEIAIETEPGDLTVHDGRMWHRVQVSPHTGERSLRRSMYVPYLTDAYAPKSDASKMPIYHRLGCTLRRVGVKV